MEEVEVREIQGKRGKRNLLEKKNLKIMINDPFQPMTYLVSA